jgi:DNA-binding MarR family transcriptional regulator
MTRQARRALWEEPCLAARVRRVHRIVSRSYDAALKDQGLTAAQLDVLMTLLTAERSVRRVELARALEMERSTVTRNLDRLVNRGLVTAVDGDTPGEARVEVTTAGRQAAEDAADAWFSAQRAIRQQLGEDGVDAVELIAGRLAGTTN